MSFDLKDMVSDEECESKLIELQTGLEYKSRVYLNSIKRDGKFHSFSICLKPQCECNICKEQFRPLCEQRRLAFTYNQVLSNSEARKQATNLTRALQENIKYLQQEVTSRGSTISKCWKKKSRDKRRSLLLDIDPEMFPENFPDIKFRHDFVAVERANYRVGAFWQDPDAKQSRARRPYRNVGLLPYINLESLEKDPARLLNMLYNRTQYSPEQWATYDSSLLNKQWNTGSFETTYNEGCIIMTGPDYGKLTPWDKNQVHTGRTVGYSRGILILEAQMKLSALLKAVVQKILEGKEKQEPSSSKKALELVLKKPTENSSCVEFASTFLNQPFAAPPNFDPGALLSIAEAQVHLHEDQLWLLQTDPTFLRNYAAAVLEGEMNEHLTVPNQHIRASHKLMEDATTFWTWDWIRQEAKKISELHEKFQSQICAGNPLPPQYEQTVGCLEALVFDLARRRATQAYRLLPTRRGFRHLYKNAFVQNSQETAVISLKKNNVETSEFMYTDRLYFCLLAIAETLTQNSSSIGDSSEYRFHDPAELFGLLDEHLSSELKMGNKDDLSRLDEILYTVYSDLSALLQVLFTLRLHRPRVSVLTLDEAKKNETGKAWRYTRAGFLDQDPSIVDPKLNTEDPTKKLRAQMSLGKVFGDFLNTSKPTGPCANQKWLDQDQAQREASSRVWAQIRSRHQETLERLGIESSDIEADLSTLSADQDPDHILSIQTEHAHILARIASKKSSRATKNASIPTQWGTDTQNGSSFAAKETRIKTKTRPDQPTADSKLTDLEPTPSVETAEVQPQETVMVGKRTLDILQSLYPTRNYAERTKKVDWASFVHAMAEVGFIARQIHGSEYSFEPVQPCKWFKHGRIVLHKPHPQPKFEVWKYLAIGKRMGKWFGWNAETFEPKLKAEVVARNT